MPKEIRKTIRMSEDMEDLIERQPGRNFSEKFTHLVFKSQWELPGLEREKEKITRQVTNIKKNLQALESAEAVVMGIVLDLSNVSEQVNKILMKCDEFLEDFDFPEPLDSE